MNIEKLLLDAQGNNQHTAVLSFRLAQEDKDALLSICEQYNLSLGKLMRGLVKELRENV